MCNGIIFVEKIDLLIKELGISRKEFAKQFDINPSTIAAWKTRNILPPIETIETIAEHFKVSIEWLVTADNISSLFDFQKVRTSRKTIRNRIYEIIASKTPVSYVDQKEAHIHFFKDIPEFSFSYLYNWSEGRININEYVFEEIAFKLGVTLDYLFSGIRTEGEIINQQQRNDANDEYILEKAKQNLNDLFCLDNLTDARKKLASDMLNQLMKLEHLEYVEKHKNDNIPS